MKKLQDSYELSNGITIPCIGFGTWQTPEGELAYNSVRDAIDIGYRHIDTATVYENEKSVGRAIKDSSIEREDLFVTTKLWNTEREAQSVRAAFEKSLSLLSLDYLDLYLIHWPSARGEKSEWVKTNSEVWKEFEALYHEGLIKAIGVSNFKVHHLEALLATAEVVPMVNQIEYHPGYMQKDICDYCSNENILIEAWSPLGSGRVLSDERLVTIAERYRCSVAQLCVKWCLQNKVLPLPKSVHTDRIRENADVFWFEISDDDMATINDFAEMGFSGLDPDKVTF